MLDIEEKRRRWRERSQAFRDRHPERANENSRRAYAKNYRNRTEAQKLKRRVTRKRSLAIYRITRREFIQSLKDRPCTDCGNKFPSCVMDFDHVTGIKLFTIAERNCISFKMIREEASKCEVVCANCHRIREWKRRDKRT